MNNDNKFECPACKQNNATLLHENLDEFFYQCHNKECENFLCDKQGWHYEIEKNKLEWTPIEVNINDKPKRRNV